MSSETENFRRCMESFGPDREDTGCIELGTVGWDDGQPHYELDAGKRTLVKVTLYRGYRPGEDKKPLDGRCGGMQILARLTRPLNFIPEDGEEVLVAIPAALRECPGAGAIIAVMSNAPDIQHSATKSKMDFGPEVDLVIKARSVTLSDYQDRFITLGPSYGVKCGAGRYTDNSAIDTSGWYLKDGEFRLAIGNDSGEVGAQIRLVDDDIRLNTKGSEQAAIRMGEGSFSFVGIIFDAQASFVGLGVGLAGLVPGVPIPRLPALCGVPLTPVASPCVFVAFP